MFLFNSLTMPSVPVGILFERSFVFEKTKNMEPLEFPDGIYFANGSEKDPAVLETIEYNIPSGYTELVMSTNLEFIGEGKFTLEVKSSNCDPWLSFGTFSTREGESGSSGYAGPKHFTVYMDTDVLKVRVDYPENQLYLRITVWGKAKIKFISFTATNIKEAKELYEKYGGYYIPSYDKGDSPKDKCRSFPVYAPTLPIPPLSQFQQPTERAARICSPTCCTMALRYAGIDTDPVKMERLTHDNKADLCGNWFLNTAGCGALGAYALVTRLNSIYEAAEILRAGIPIAASITVPEGALPGFPLGKTAGHFVLIKGITEKGDFVVNDPAAPSADKAEIIYPGKEFLDAWFGQKQGLCYIIMKDLSKFLRISLESAKIYSKPDRKSTLETQSLYYEPITLYKTEKEWAYICVDEQQDNDIDAGTIIPYKGWMEMLYIAFHIPMPYASMLGNRGIKPLMRDASNMNPWCYMKPYTGTMLPFLLKDSLPPETMSPQEKTKGMSDDGIAAFRQHILENARKYLGCKYILGGRTDDGIDCSGLVGMAYLLSGIRLPRNAHGQYIAAKPVAPSEMKPADLLFLSDSQNERKIGHVMLYLGEERLIEATITAGMVREISCEEKFGVPFAELKNGMTLPKGNKFYCGAVL